MKRFFRINTLNLFENERPNGGFGSAIFADPTEKNLKNLHEASMKMIERTGVKLHHAEMLALAEANGIAVADGRVRFTRDQLEEWLSHAPSEFTIYARNPAYDMHIGGDRVEHVSSNSGFPFIVDWAGNYRKATFNDYIQFLKLVHATPLFNMNGGVMVTPDDVPSDDNLYPTLLYTAMLHSDKCLFGGMGGKTESINTMRMLEAAFGADKEELVRKPRIANLVSTLSPLQFDAKMLDTLMVYADYGQPIVISPAVMAGTTGPVTMAGTIAVSNAEALVGIALAQMVRKGTPVIFGSATSNADMGTGAFTIGTPESALAMKYCARLAKIYDLPCRGGGTLNDAKSLSIQAGYESMMVQFVANQERINFNFHSAGGMDSYGAMSYEKYVADLEILDRIEYYLADLNTDEDSLAVDIVDMVGPGGQFLTQMHTAVNCRKTPFKSRISLRGAMPDGSAPDSVLQSRIQKELDRMLDAYQQPELPRASLARLDEAMRAIGVDPLAIRNKIRKIADIEPEEDPAAAPVEVPDDYVAPIAVPEVVRQTISTL